VVSIQRKLKYGFRHYFPFLIAFAIAILVNVLLAFDGGLLSDGFETFDLNARPGGYLNKCIWKTPSSLRKYNIKSIDKFGWPYECSKIRGDRRGCGCNDDYLDFIFCAGQYLAINDISHGEIRERFRSISSGERPLSHDELNPNQLKQTLLDVTNIRFAYEGVKNQLESIDKRQLIVVAIREDNSRDKYSEIELVFKDPLVGEFRALLLKPNKSQYNRNSAIIALHGHGYDPEYHVKNYLGEELALNGHSVIIISSRSMCAGNTESITTMEMLKIGIPFVLLQAYEVSLVKKYLKHKDYKKIGLIGHSGGSVIGNVFMRVDGDVDAYVSDFMSDFNGGYKFAETGSIEGLCHEKSYVLWKYNLLINNFSTLETPFLRVGYDYLEKDLKTGEVYYNYKDDIVRFFDINLMD
jgi:hypothetical protein